MFCVGISASAVISGDGPLTPVARAQFLDELVAEGRKQVADKAGYFGFPAGVIAFVILARFGLLVAAIGAFVAMALGWKAGEVFFENKYLDPIGSYSDQMLVARYHESKADLRAAGARTTLWRVVFVVVAILLLIGWMASRRP